MWNKPQILNWIANLLYAVAVVMFLYGVLFVVVHLPIFPLREVRIEGELKHVSSQQVKLITARYLKGNFFTVDLEKTRDAFKKLPWARNVTVRRRWPSALEVVIEEHKELARWGNVALVNTYGELFNAASDSELPIFLGPADGVHEVTKHYGALSELLGSVEMKVSEIALTPRRSWQIRTDNGLIIALGRDEMVSRLKRFVSVYPQTLASANGHLNYVDLRYPNGFSLRKLGGVEANKALASVLDKKQTNQSLKAKQKNSEAQKSGRLNQSKQKK